MAKCVKTVVGASRVSRDPILRPKHRVASHRASHGSTLRETGPGGTGRAVASETRASRRSWNGPVGRPQWSARCRRDRTASYFSWRHAARITWHHTPRTCAPTSCGATTSDVPRTDALYRPGGETTPADDARARQQMRQWSRRRIYARRR